MRNLHSRGMTLVEIAVALIVLSIAVLAGMSSFTASQKQIIGAAIQDRMYQVAQNEAERVFSLPYDQVNPLAARAVTVDGKDYTLSTAVVEDLLNPPALNPKVKKVTITVTVTNPNDSITLIITKAPE